jgi:hypothetical protein
MIVLSLFYRDFYKAFGSCSGANAVAAWKILGQNPVNKVYCNFFHGPEQERICTKIRAENTS